MAKSMRGVSLVPGQVVVLSITGTLVYVEDVQPTHIAVLALPEQLTDQTKQEIFTPGCVGVRKISPYSAAEAVIDVPSLSPRNAKFIGEYEQLRSQHGPRYVDRTPAEKAAFEASIGKKPRGERKSRVEPDETDKTERKQTARAERRKKKQKCATCGKPRNHADHQFTQGGCAFVEPAGRAPRAEKPAKGSADPIYKLVNEDLTALEAQDESKWGPGNRFRRVFRALTTLTDKSGTLAQVMSAVVLDGGRPMSNPEKVTSRALTQLVKAGNVTR